MKPNRPLFSAAALCLACAAPLSAKMPRGSRPNVILIMTDDQGYGDVGCHGNPVLKTPNLDRLHGQSVRLTDFHVSPFCTPTRAALMTGRYPARTGAYRTSSGRSMLHTDERTIANVFADAGYVTGMVGKWHLGDCAPHRPQDRGFQDVVWHRGGGVGQAPDYWGNDYFDDTYERNGKFEKFEGYCTDVWFAEAMRFVEENKSRPFFLYVSTNAPHSPYRVGPKWSKPYRKAVKWKGGAEFYGMIANLDWNIGLLRERLGRLGLSDNTMFVFMTDNGTSNGIARQKLAPGDYRGFNAGMRGVKSTVYEGGHRVPFFIHWPAGGITGGRDGTNLSAHLDVLPTLAELCGIPLPADLQLDGASFAAQLRDPAAPPHRDHVVVQLQGGTRFKGGVKPWALSCVVKDRWRLIDGSKLTNLDEDPMQSRDVSAKHPEVFKELRDLYVKFWDSVSPRMTPVSIDLGNPAQNPTELCSQDWYLPTGNPPWHTGHIRQRVRVTGPWQVDVKQAGRYRLTLRQFPAVADEAIAAVRAKVRVAGQEAESEVEPGAKRVAFELDLPAGKAELQTWLFDKNGKAGGAYFTEVEALAASTHARTDQTKEWITSNGVTFMAKAHYPQFSWDTVPVYMMFADDDRLLDDSEVRKIAAESDVICIEKQHGRKKLGGAERGLTHETRAFKQVKPGIKVLGYFNAAIAYPFTSHTKMLTAKGLAQAPRMQEYLLIDPKTGELAHRGPFYFYDALNPGLRAWWSDAAATIVRESGADGIFIDQMHGFKWLRWDKRDAVEAAVADMLRQLKEKMGPGKILLANNGAREEKVFPIADAFMFEHYRPEITETKERLLGDWQLMERIADAGKLCVNRFGARAEPDSPLAKSHRQDKIKHKVGEWAELSKKQLPFYLAVYLIGAQPYSYFQWGWGWGLATGPLVDYPEFHRPLGRPLGKYERVHADKWQFTREFEHVSVWVDTENREARLEWRRP